jgi:hypothetical protein
MDNNRLFLVHLPTGSAILLGFRVRGCKGWHSDEGGISEHELNRFYDACMTGSARPECRQDDFVLALEDNHLAPATAEIIDCQLGDGALKVRIRPPITEVSHLCARRAVDEETLECIACGRRWVDSAIVPDYPRVWLRQAGERYNYPPSLDYRFVLNVDKNGDGMASRYPTYPDTVIVPVSRLERLNNPGDKLADLLEVRISFREGEERA